VTHDKELAAICDRVIEIKDGVVQEEEVKSIGENGVI